VRHATRRPVKNKLLFRLFFPTVCATNHSWRVLGSSQLPGHARRRQQLTTEVADLTDFALTQDSLLRKTANFQGRNELAGTRPIGRGPVHVPSWGFAVPP